MSRIAATRNKVANAILYGVRESAGIVIGNFRTGKQWFWRIDHETLTAALWRNIPMQRRNVLLATATACFTLAGLPARTFAARVSIVLLLLLSSAATARTWTDSAGKHKIEADLLSQQDGHITLKKRDGNVIRVPLRNLSDADQRYAREQTVKPTKDSDSKVVTAEGVGVTAKDALKEAFRSAVDRVVGTVVDAETIVKNDELIRDRVLTYSSGFVSTYDVLSEEQEGGLFRVRIRATVARGKLVARLQDEKIVASDVDGKGLFSEAVTQFEREKDGAKIIRRVFEGFPGNVLTAEPVGKPRIIEKTETEATVGITVRFSVDAKEYSTWLQAFKPTLSKLASKEDSFLWNIRQPAEADRRQGYYPRPLTDLRESNDWAFDQLNFPWDERNRRVSHGFDRWGTLSLTQADARTSYDVSRSIGQRPFPTEFRGKDVLLILERQGGGRIMAYELEQKVYEEVAYAVLAIPVVNVALKNEKGEIVDATERVAFFGDKWHKFHASPFWRFRDQQYQFIESLPMNLGNNSQQWSALQPHSKLDGSYVAELQDPQYCLLVAPYLGGVRALMSAFQNEFVFHIALEDLPSISEVEVHISSRNNLLDDSHE